MVRNVKEYLEEHYPDENLIIFDGFDDAFVGVGFSFTQPFVCYSKTKMIEILMTEGSLTLDEAIEYMDFNVIGMYAGETTPIIIEDGV